MEIQTAEKIWSREFLECVEDKLQPQLVSEPARKDCLLDLVFAKRGSVCGVKVGRLS